jgi:drug/metabolite transporter (DMT)-like permease
MSVPLTVRWGIGLAFVTALISGVSIFLNGLYVKEFHDPILLAAVRNSLVGLVLLAALATTRPWSPETRLSSRQRAGLAVLGVIGGGVSFALFFTGLSLVPSAGAAIIQKTLFVWVAILAVPFLGERLGWAQVAAVVLLLAGTLTLGDPGSVTLGPGEGLILVATLLWAVEVIVARRLLGGMGSLPVATARMVIGGLVLLAIVAVRGDLGGVVAYSSRQWLIVGVTALLLTGYVTTWYAALKRAPATVVTSVLVIGAVVTSVLQSLAKGSLPRGPELVGLGLLIVGVGAAAAIATIRGRSPSETTPAAGVS